MTENEMPRRLALGLLAGLAIAAGARAQTAAQTAAQPELPKEKLTIVTHDGKRHDFNVEMALKPEQQITGLMFRPSVPEDGGMLFDWGMERVSEMWMRNTVAPLDMIFIGGDGTIRALAENTIPYSEAVISSRVPVRATLEVAAGTVRRLDIRVGDKVEQRIFAPAPKG
jgi:uncharacterized protein